VLLVPPFAEHLRLQSKAKSTNYNPGLCPNLSRLANFGMPLGLFIPVAYAIVFIKKPKCAWEDMKAKIGVTTSSRNKRVCPFSIQPHAYVFFKSSNQWPVLVTNTLAQGNINFLWSVGVKNRYDLAFMMVRRSREISGSVGQNLYPTFVYVASSGHRPLVNYFQNNPGGLRVLRKRFARMLPSFNDDSGTLGFAEDVSLPLYSSKRSKSEAHAKTPNNDQQSRQDVISKGQFVGSSPGFVLFGCLVFILSLIAGALGGAIFFDGLADGNARRKCGGGLLAVLGYLSFCFSLLTMVFDCLRWNWNSCLQSTDQHGYKCELHVYITVTQQITYKFTIDISQDLWYSLVCYLEETSSTAPTLNPVV